MAEIGLAILGKISEYSVEPIGRQLSYLFQLSGNVKTLRKELEKLQKLKGDVQFQVDGAIDNVEYILAIVEKWLEDVGKAEREAQTIIDDKARFPKGCLNGWFLNIKSRHALSRKAKKRTQDIIDLRKEGDFSKVSGGQRREPNTSLNPIPAPPVSLPYIIDSRELILKEIIESLKDANINMIGICGMGGVGKTTMVEDVFKRVKDENMFDDYAMTVVSQKPNMVNVQRDIAEMLRLKFEEKNPVIRARLLNQRLDGKKVLILLDDIWEEFILKDLGITLQGGQRNCKIVFTSRTQGLWLDFESRKREWLLHELPYSEAWDLFKEKVGKYLDEKPEFVPIAEYIVKECGGLPLAVVVLGRALRGKSMHAWNDTLIKLRTTSGVEPQVDKSLRLSYDHLGDNEAKSLFLLCSLFEEDSRIYIESLVNMGMGLRLFKGTNKVEKARDRVFTLVEHLQSRCLVSNKKAYITVHDLVRDVSKSIASTEKSSLVLEQGVTLEELLDQTLPEHCTRISILSNEITKLPSQLQLPKLELLRWSNNSLQQIPDSCFEGMAKLQVLDINRSLNPYYVGSWAVLALPSSFQSLTRLHTLSLQCFTMDFTAIKYLQNLEILRIADTYIKELPKEIGQLTKLRLLDMSDCKRLKRISPGIISGLTVLEELYLDGLDIDWGAKENEEGRIAAQREFKSLSNLYILHIVIKDPSFVPSFKNLKKYKIQIGYEEIDFINYASFIIDSQKYERKLSIFGVALGKDFKFLVHHSEALLLKGKSTKNLVCELVREASQSIKCLVISGTETPEYLANVMDCTKAPFLVSTLESLLLESLDNLQQIINGQLVSGNFAKLKKLYVSRCKQLRNIFRLSNAVDVFLLEVLRVEDCESMGEVICWEGNNKLQFPNLKKIEIESCKSLISFCKGANEIEFHQLEFMRLESIAAVECIVSNSDENGLNSIFPPKVLFPKLVSMTLYGLTNMKKIVDGPLETWSLVKLQWLYVGNCNQLSNIFRLPTETDIVHLQELRIWKCESMEEVIKWEGREEDATSKLQFPKLRKLEIEKSCVVCFCRKIKEIEFHQLDSLELNELPGVEFLVSGSNENHLKSMFPHKVLFPRLDEMELSSMPNMKEIWCGQPQVRSFCNLGRLYIEGCNSLEYVFSPFMARYLVHLHTLRIYQCQSLKEVVAAEKDKDVEEYSSSILPKLQIVDLVCLPALGKFCHIAKDLEFCVLEGVEVVDCPEFKTFAPGFVHTPNLNHVKLDNGMETLWKENLNNTIQHLYKDQQQQRRQQQDEKEGDNENEIKEDS